MTRIAQLFRAGGRRFTRITFGESEALRRAGLPGMPRPFHPWFVIAMAMIRTFLALFTKLELVGLANIPTRGGMILAANHISSADPPILAAAVVSRWPRFMAKLELFQKRALIGYLFALSGAFPVQRSKADLSALRDAQRLIRGGHILCMFPEGHRSPTATLIEAHPGTAMIALRTGAPIIPVAITGSEGLRHGWRVLTKRAPIRIVFGPPFHLAGGHLEGGRVDRAAIEAGNARIMRGIATQLPARYRGVYRQRFADLPEHAAVDLPPPAPGTLGAPPKGDTA